MEQILIYVILFAIIVVIGQSFDKFPIPLPLLLLVAGMLLSFIPNISVSINSTVVLNIFLPMLVYEISAFISWKDFRKNIVPISLLSVGHVVFITILVALVINWLIPQLGWPLAIVIGAIVSPPDDVAIVSIAEKIRMPETVIVILEGEGMLNDAAALTIFRFGLAAALTHQFLFSHAITAFTIDIVAEAIYGLCLGYVIGELRLKIKNASLHVIASLLTPFIAYCPVALLGGSGIVATVAIGFVIGHFYATRFNPGFRLISRAMWPSISNGIQYFLFLLAGHSLFSIMKNIATIPMKSLMIYSGAIIAVVILGRFIWVYFANLYVPRRLFPSLRQKIIPWQYPFLISWAGMRGSISLAAAFAVPQLPNLIYGANARDLLIFLVFMVIIVTLLLQGLALPWLLKLIGTAKISDCEQYREHISALNAEQKMAKTTLDWLKEAFKQKQNDNKPVEEIQFWINHYKTVKKRLTKRIKAHGDITAHDEEAEVMEDIALQLELIDVEKNQLMELWAQDKINMVVRNQLLDKLDHRAKNLKS